MTSFAAGTLIVLGVLLTFLGLFAAGDLGFVLAGLGSVAGGGLLGLFERRVPVLSRRGQPVDSRLDGSQVRG